MIIFINDIPVRLLKTREQPDEGRINHVVDAAQEPVTQAKLIHHVWVKNASDTDLDLLLEFLDSKVPTSLLSLVVSVDNYALAKNHLRSKFKVVKAAGGLVRKKEKSLMIYRTKKWDLPKGKLDEGETIEECNTHDFSQRQMGSAERQKGERGEVSSDCAA